MDEWPDVCFYDIDDDRIMAPAASRRLSQSSIPNGLELCNLLRTAKERFAALRTTGKPWYEMSGTFAFAQASAKAKSASNTLHSLRRRRQDRHADPAGVGDLPARPGLRHFFARPGGINLRSVSGRIGGSDADNDDLFGCTYLLTEGKSFYDRLQEEVAKEVRKSAYEDYLEEFSQTQLFCQYYESLLQVDPDGKKL